MQIVSLGREDPLEKEMATHCSILAWEIPWTEEPGRPEFTESKESDMTDQLSMNTRDGQRTFHRQQPESTAL